MEEHESREIVIIFLVTQTIELLPVVVFVPRDEVDGDSGPLDPIDFRLTHIRTQGHFEGHERPLQRESAFFHLTVAGHKENHFMSQPGLGTGKRTADLP